jgi:hypothetical protein
MLVVLILCSWSLVKLRLPAAVEVAKDSSV